MSSMPSPEKINYRHPISLVLAIIIIAGLYSDDQKKKNTEQEALIMFQEYNRAANELLGQTSIEICLAAELPVAINLEMLQEDLEIAIELLNSVTGNINYTEDSEMCDIQVLPVDFSRNIGPVKVLSSSLLGRADLNPDGIDTINIKAGYYQLPTTPDTRYCSTATLVHEMLHSLYSSLDGYPYQDPSNRTHSTRRQDILFPYSKDEVCQVPSFNPEEYDYFRSQYLAARLSHALSGPRSR